MTDFLTIEIADGVALLTTNSPETRNVLGFDQPSAEIEAACAMIAANRDVRAVVLTGACKAFSAGGDIKNMATRLYSQDRQPIDDCYYYKEGIHRIPRALYQLEVPVIAAVNGAAIGAALDLACMCDVRISGQGATFAESFVKLGIIPGDGGAFLLQRILGQSKAAIMTFTGNTIDATKAFSCGLVSQVVPDDQLQLTAMSLAARIAQNPAHAFRMAKRLMRESTHLELDTVLEFSAAFQGSAHSSTDHRERLLHAVAAMAKKR